MTPRIATASTVDRSELLDFLGQRHHAVLVTMRRTGGSQLSPITCGVDEAGRVLVSSYPQRAKVHNIRRDSTVDITRWGPVATGGFPPVLAGPG